MIYLTNIIRINNKAIQVIMNNNFTLVFNLHKFRSIIIHNHNLTKNNWNKEKVYRIILTRIFQVEEEGMNNNKEFLYIVLINQ